jgi:hypothetical protein
MTAPARKTRQRPRQGRGGAGQGADLAKGKNLGQIAPRSPAGIERLAVLFAEQAADIRALQQEVRELRDIRAPAPPAPPAPPAAWPIPAGYASLKDAAAACSRSAEAVRLWAAAGKIAALRRNGRWYVKASDAVALAQRLERLEPVLQTRAAR